MMKKNVKLIITEDIYNSIMSETTTGSYTAYHGSNQQITEFTDVHVGKEDAKDEEGAGIYFTTSYEDAIQYGKYVYTVEISGRKYVDDKTPSDDVDIEELVSLLKMDEDWEMTAQNWDEDPESGVYSAAQDFINYNNSEKEVFLQAWYDFFRYAPINYVRGMTKLGYDGLVTTPYKSSDNKGLHIIVYNPKAIQITNEEIINVE